MKPQVRAAFIKAVNGNSSMKALKRDFGMTKEEVDENIRLIPYHVLYLKSTEDIKRVRQRSDLTNAEKLRVITHIRAALKQKWKVISGKA